MRALAHLTLLSLLFATSAVQSDTLDPASGVNTPTTATAPSPAPTTPSPAPTTPSPTPTAPSPAPTAPSPAPTAPSPAPTAPSPAPTAPSPAPTAPSPAPTTPSPAPTAPSPAPTTPSPAPTIASSTAPTKSPSSTTAPTTPTPPPPSVSVSSPVPASTVTPTESKTNSTAKTTPIAATNTTPPGSGNLGSTAPTSNGSTITPGTQNNSSEAVTSVTSGNITLSTISTPNPGPTVPISPCQGAPCQDGSSCVSLNNTHFCLCSLGYYYQSSICRKGKLFPGTITVKVSGTSGLEDGNSMAYQKLHIQITDFFKSTFANSDYGQTVIDEVSILSSARSEMRAGNSAVVAKVLNIFAETTKENEKTVSESIKNAIQSSASDMLYNARSLCDYYGCEPENEQDNCGNGLLCKCKQGMERPNPQVPMCVASALRCPNTCNADHNKQCLVNKNTGTPECVCLPGYKESDGGICQKCAFGYSGVHCEDQFQLILTVVGSLGGALILCLVIALIVLASSKNKNKNIEEENLIENDFQNLRLQQTTTGFSNSGSNGSIFPKVRANIPDQPQNPYAHQRSLPRPDY